MPCDENQYTVHLRVLQLFEGFAMIWSRDIERESKEMESSKQKCVINSEVLQIKDSKQYKYTNARGLVK